MKKILLSMMAFSLLLTACLKDEGNHLSQLISPEGYGKVYADQEVDSLRYATTERHTVTTSAEWLQADADFISGIKFKDDAIYTFSVPIHFQANTTGKIRRASVAINAGEYSIGAYFLQWPFLNVSRPVRFINSNTMEVISYGPLADSAFVTVDSIRFTTYDDWTLTTGKWATPAQTSGRAGTHTIQLNLEPYESTLADRRDTLLLTSRGVTDSIPLLQYKRRVTE